ncbi:MAG: hypothetical protein LBG15_09610 [Dysgonamonadaceae bacterium]|jgi:hypothetical protein|nr:hypothetical protein [Dysgonamonadaceae bacterium]
MKKTILFFQSFFFSEMGFFVLLLSIWDILFNDLIILYKELSVIFFLGLILRIGGIFLKKSTNVPVENNDNVKLMAKRKLFFLLKSFIFSGVSYFFLYQLLWSFIINYPDANPYKQIYVSIFFGIFLGIDLMEYIYDVKSKILNYE